MDIESWSGKNMKRTRRLQIDANSDDAVEKFNILWGEISSRFNLADEQVDLTYKQAAEVLGLTELTVLDYANRGILRRGEAKTTVHVDDVVQRLQLKRKV